MSLTFTNAAGLFTGAVVFLTAVRLLAGVWRNGSRRKSLVLGAAIYAGLLAGGLYTAGYAIRLFNEPGVEPFMVTELIFAPAGHVMRASWLLFAIHTYNRTGSVDLNARVDDVQRRAEALELVMRRDDEPGAADLAGTDRGNA